MPDDNKQFYISVYDEIVSGGEMTRDEIRREFSMRLATASAEGKITLPPISDYERFSWEFEKAVEPERTRRRGRFRKDLDFIVDTLLEQTSTLLGDIDPILRLAFPLGNGSDKRLREWTVDDMHQAINVRDQVVADQAAEADKFRVAAERAISLMQKYATDTLGSLSVTVAGAA